MTYNFVSRDNCPACGSTQVITLFSSSFSDGGIGVFVRDWYHIEPAILDGAPYELQQCSTCELIFQHYIGDAELMRDLYTEWQYKRWNWYPGQSQPEDSAVYSEHLRETELSLFAHELMVASSFLGVPLKDMKTLDYGMGWGLWVRIAKKLGCDSFGLEVSEEHREYVRRHGCGAITDDELHEHQFHFVNTEQVFEHLPDPLSVLKRMSDALVPGGVVKISVPSGKRADKIIQALKDGSYVGDYKTIMPLHPLEHVNTFNRRSIEVMAGVAGLRIVKPSLLQSYSFLRHKGAVSLKRPKKSLKELVRPWYQWVNPSNIYLWLQKPE